MEKKQWGWRAYLTRIVESGALQRVTAYSYYHTQCKPEAFPGVVIKPWTSHTGADTYCDTCGRLISY